MISPDDVDSRAPEIDISELESLFSAASVSDGKGSIKAGGRRGSHINKPEKVQLVRCFICLSGCALIALY